MSAESFPLLSLPFPAVRHFLSVLPIKDVLTVRKTCKTLKNWSCFRGKVVKMLTVHNDTVNYNCCIPYDDLLTNRFPIIPLDELNVFMTPSYSSEAIMTSIDSHVFKELRIYDDYKWQQVIPFIHGGLEKAFLFDKMELSAHDMPAFFEAISSFRGEFLWINCDNVKHHWIKSALQVWSSLKGSVFKSVKLQYCDLIEAVKIDGKVIQLLFTISGQPPVFQG